MKRFIVALATAAVAMVVLSAVRPVAPMPLSGELDPVACATPTALYDLLNAADHHDAKETAHLANGACQPLAGTRYQVERVLNGIVVLRIFPADGSWAKSHLAYTLDEMIATPDTAR
ncbi:MAG: hypothetical protein JO010_11990 [Alphaproteobacteria bacterium]|nr:hypothetical protein [Alphaproteobacteria bacterium]